MDQTSKLDLAVIDHQNLRLFHIAVALTNKSQEFALYITDPDLSNFAVDASANQVIIVDAEHIILVDKNRPNMKSDSFSIAEHSECGPNCLQFSVDDLCSHRMSDHNIYAICRVLQTTDLLRGGPEDSELQKIIKDCVFGRDSSRFRFVGEFRGFIDRNALMIQLFFTVLLEKLIQPFCTHANVTDNKEVVLECDEGTCGRNGYVIPWASFRNPKFGTLTLYVWIKGWVPGPLGVGLWIAEHVAESRGRVNSRLSSHVWKKWVRDTLGVVPEPKIWDVDVVVWIKGWVPGPLGIGLWIAEHVAESRGRVNSRLSSYRGTLNAIVFSYHRLVDVIWAIGVTVTSSHKLGKNCFLLSAAATEEP
ncbi:unnamed protein product [Notodromas monacha]|uniref:FAM69 protein-kinase domain-containing protein n=1 Tax=Notodromas monacha TaxID=399045 RepID=A0A7R9BSK8_9CRUS|nr:unnamed protein product [Notodromas monacha]CAG0920947.1 unnamed protein product [Notodromas monacha]